MRHVIAPQRTSRLLGVVVACAVIVVVLIVFLVGSILESQDSEATSAEGTLMASSTTDRLSAGSSSGSSSASKGSGSKSSATGGLMFDETGRGYVLQADGSKFTDFKTRIIDAVNAIGTADFQTTMTCSAASLDGVRAVINEFHDQDYSVGFVFVDLSNGATMSYNPYEEYYCASTIKSSFCAYFLSQKVNTGEVDYDDYEEDLYETIVNSDNDTYQYLRERFSDQGLIDWYDTAGVGFVGSDWYVDVGAADFAKVWACDVEYLLSGDPHAEDFRSWHLDARNSAIDEAIDECDVYTKAGWYPPNLNDAGVIANLNGRPYLLTIFTDSMGADPNLLIELTNALSIAAKTVS